MFNDAAGALRNLAAVQAHLAAVQARLDTLISLERGQPTTMSPRDGFGGLCALCGATFATEEQRDAHRSEWARTSKCPERSAQVSPYPRGLVVITWSIAAGIGLSFAVVELWMRMGGAS